MRRIQVADQGYEYAAGKPAVVALILGHVCAAVAAEYVLPAAVALHVLHHRM